MEKIKDTKWAYKFIQKHSTRAFPKEHQSKGNYGLWYVTQSWKTHYGSYVKVHFKHMKMCICVTHNKIPLVFDQGDKWCNNSLRRQKLTWTLNHDNVILYDSINYLLTSVSVLWWILQVSSKSFFHIETLIIWRCHRRCSIKKGVFKNFANFTGKHLWHSLFLWLWHRGFPVNFAKFLRTLFSKNTSGWLLLNDTLNINHYWRLQNRD